MIKDSKDNMKSEVTDSLKENIDKLVDASSKAVTRFISPPKRLLNALDHKKVASLSRAWCRFSSAIYKSIYRVSELVRILAGSVFDPGWWLGGSMSVEV